MIIRTKPDIQKALDWLSNYELVSFDVETNSLAHRSGKLIGFGCATPTDLTGFYIIMREWANGQLIDVLTEADVLPIIQVLQTKKLLGWNFCFDASWALSKFGINLMPTLHCEVMLACHSCDENKPQYGLKFISAQLFGSSVVGEQTDMKESIKANGGSATEYYKADSTLMAKYGLQDNILTCKNYLHWWADLERQGLIDFYNNEVLALQKEVTFDMQYKGIPVDVPALEQSKAEIEKDMASLEDQIQEQIKPLLGNFHDWYLSRHYPFKFTPAFKAKLASQLKITSWPKTKSGGLSFSQTDVIRAVKKGLIDTNTEFYKIVMQQIKPSAELIKQVQLALLADEGTKYAFNLLSTDHLKRLFFKANGATLDENALSFTDKGSPQINDEFLNKMAAKYAWAEDLRTYRSLSKLRGTYIDGILERAEDGIFYPQFFQHRTVSGRMAGNTQQLPRLLEKGQADDLIIKYTNRVRAFFKCSDAETFLDFDYDSQEVKVFAHVSGDQRIKDIFARGEDFYSAICIMAEKLTGYSADKQASNYLGKINKQARQRAKAYALGLAFNMSPYKLKFELNCSEAEAQEIYNNYFKAFPDLKKWLDASIKFACENGYIKTEAGRIRRFPDLKRYYTKYGSMLFDGLELWKEYNDSPREYTEMKRIAGICKNEINNAVNVQVQGLAASITNRAAIKTAKELKAAGLQARICNLIHDQITVLCPLEEKAQASQILQNAMETAYTISVPLTAPPSSGQNWAESK